jgi:hypothetical protein
VSAPIDSMRLVVAVLAMSLASLEGVRPTHEQASPSPREATACNLLKEPTAWNHVRVRVTAVATHAFEDFSLSSPACESTQNAIWLTYGGRANSETIYCCPGEGEESLRAEPLVLEGVTLPLVEDATFNRFRELLRKHPRVAAQVTVVGTFFAGAQMRAGLGGFGHVGCCSLLVIERVEQFQDIGNAPENGVERSCSTCPKAVQWPYECTPSASRKWATRPRRADNPARRYHCRPRRRRWG